MEFSKIATDMNTKVANGEQGTVDVELDDNKVVTCAIIIVLTVNGKDYILMRRARMTMETSGSMNLSARMRTVSPNLATSKMMMNTRRSPRPLTSIWTMRNLTNL